MTLIVTPFQSGSLSNTASATGNESNPNPVGATTTFTTTVQAFPSIYVASLDAGATPEVKVFSSQDGSTKIDFNAYDAAFLGGVRVAVGDVNGDGIPDIVTVPGGSGGPLVQVFSGKDFSLIVAFNAFNTDFRGGLFVAVGDVDGDGFGDVIVSFDSPSSGAGFGGPLVQVFSGQKLLQVGSVDLTTLLSQTLIVSFNAYDPSFIGGVRVAAADVSGTGRAQIITSPGSGGGSLVEIFDQTGTKQFSFNAYDTTYNQGVFVAAADLNGDGKADIITGGVNSAQVRTFNSADQTLLQSTTAFPSSFTGSVHVAATTNVNGGGKADLVLGQGAGGQPQVEILDALSLANLDTFFAFNSGFNGGIFVAGK
jgi:hypothetical protein